MPINLPSSSRQLKSRSKTDVQRELPGSDPFLKNSLVGAITSASANRVFDFYQQLNLLQKLLLPDEADGELLDRWAAIYGLSILAATKSSGIVVATGTPGQSVNIGTVLSGSNGLLYEATATSTIVSNSLPVSSLTRSGNVATVVTINPHGLSSSVSPTISGADQTAYNGVKNILSIVDGNTFTFEVLGSPVTPASGTITVDFSGTNVPVESVDFQNTQNGIEVNLPTGSSLSLQSPLVGVDNILGVGATPIGGGTDQETTEQLRNRLLQRIQNPTSHFSVSDIQDKAFEVPGVTRVFVQEVTPAVGQVTIYFMRDNDDNPIPDSGEVSTVKDRILTIKPANTSSSDVIVAAPTATSQDFTFSSLTPNTPSMQVAVKANLSQFFEEDTVVGQNVDEDAYRAAIKNTIDLETGDTVKSFTLTTPSGDLTIGTGAIGVLGTVTFP